MKPWCVGHHCVVIHSPPPPNHVCVPLCVCVDRGVLCSCMTNGVCVVVEGDWWHLWLVAYLCHPHVCLFVIHHKWHSPRMPILCYTTPIGWQEDLVTCHHALVDCFVTTPFLPFQPQLSPLLSLTILFFSRLLLRACLETIFWMYLMVSVSVSSSFFPFQWFMV